MNRSWPTHLLDQLELLDTKEAPHGLYGIRRAYVPEGRLPSAAHVLGAPGKADLLRKCGFSGRSSDQWSDTLSFSTGAERVSLQILDYATTKIRHFGSAFRLDKRHTKQSTEPRWDLETLVPRLSKQSCSRETCALLLIGHYVTPREIEGVLGKTIQPAFLDRYSLEHHTRAWDDWYGRGFRTALHLWVPRVNDEVAEAAPAHA
jgi:hypothetical protein